MKRTENSSAVEFVHPDLMTPITAIGGNYTFTRIERFKLGEDEILYLVGVGVLDSTCCGYGGCAYAFVPGRIDQWHVKTDADGRPVNHKWGELLRTQDLKPIYEENSNLYIFRAETLERLNNRIGEQPLMFEIAREEAWDIDEELDFKIAEFLHLQRKDMETDHT